MSLTSKLLKDETILLHDDVTGYDISKNLRSMIYQPQPHFGDDFLRIILVPPQLSIDQTVRETTSEYGAALRELSS